MNASYEVLDEGDGFSCLLAAEAGSAQIYRTAPCEFGKFLVMIRREEVTSPWNSQLKI